MSAQKTVVCIQDDIQTAGLVRLLLKGQGVKTISARSGKTGLEMVRRLKPDLVLLDVYTRDMSGWEIYQRILDDRELKDTPVIILSGYPEAIASALGKDFHAAAGYVCKPFSPVELREAVDRVLGLGYSVVSSQ